MFSHHTTNNIILSHGYNAKGYFFLFLSIPKDPKSYISNSENCNRGISLFIASCNVFDHAIIYLCGNCFETSNMKFGFKKHHFTVLV